MQVLKFGGTSVANAQNISRVVDIVCSALEHDRTILVCSAISGCTDTLIRIGHLAAERNPEYEELIASLHQRHLDIIHQLLPADSQPAVIATIDALFHSLSGIAQGVCLVGELSPTSLDAIQAFGELLSTRIIAARFASLGVSGKWVDSRKVILTRPDAGSMFSSHVVVVDATAQRLNQLLEQDSLTSLFIFPGFIAADEQGRTTTLGRGGSDYTASLYAACVKARNLEIWTDVSGMMTANPRIVPTARTIRHISYRAALELSHFGAKVVYPPTIQPVVAQGIPIWVKNTFAPEDYGTLIEQNPPRSEQNLTGITCSDNIALISLEGSGMVGVPGFTSRLFDALSRQNINIILITQASSVHTMCIAIAERDAEKARRAADTCFAYEISLGKINPLKVETGYSIVCLVGDDVLAQTGATGRMLTALGSHGIRVRATAQGSSERNISVIVSSDVITDAIQYIHNEFFDKQPEKIVNLFLSGYGTVGRALIRQIKEGTEAIARLTGKQIRLCGIANSRHYLLSTDGLSLDSLDEALEHGADASDGAYYEALSRLTVKHAIFADCTASHEVAHHYIDLLRRNYHVVACNKIAFSSDYALYDAIVSEARQHSRTLRYETTVGAALPVLETVRRLHFSGDRIEHVEALLSGTLGYIFSAYRGSDGPSLAAVVREAQQRGYTEPDPRLDLSGRDVLRKLLIIAREAGLKLDESAVEVSPLLSPDYFSGSVDDFYRLLADNESSFRALYDSAKKEGKVLRYLASLDITDGQYHATTGLCAVGPDSPFFALEGSDNLVAIRSQYYPSPLVIRGAGAGADQTASGVLNDILL